jgi:hypothetical protein
MLEFVHLLSEVSLEETRVEETQHSLFQQFVLRVVRAFLLEWSEADELPLDDMVGKFCLFYILLILLAVLVQLMLSQTMLNFEQNNHWADFLMVVHFSGT